MLFAGVYKQTGAVLGVGVEVEMGDTILALMENFSRVVNRVMREDGMGQTDWTHSPKDTGETFCLSLPHSKVNITIRLKEKPSPDIFMFKVSVDHSAGCVLLSCLIAKMRGDEGIKIGTVNRTDKSLMIRIDRGHRRYRPHADKTTLPNLDLRAILADLTSGNIR